MSAQLALDNPVFRTFLGYASLVIVKTVAMSVVTSFHRLTRKVFINPEDAVGLSNKGLTSNDPVVERVRRIHLNDLENVIPFVLLGLLYVRRLVGIKANYNAVAQGARRIAFNPDYLLGYISEVKHNLMWMQCQVTWHPCCSWDSGKEAKIGQPKTSFANNHNNRKGRNENVWKHPTMEDIQAEQIKESMLLPNKKSLVTNCFVRLQWI